MTTPMHYKGYLARVEYDALDKIFVGHIAGIKDVVGFHATTVTSLEKAFAESVDNYLAACKQLGEQPNKPFSGRMMLRLEPSAHQRIALAAEVRGISINQWASETLTNAAEFAEAA